MRPKASQQHLQIAAAFANAVTVCCDESKINHDFFPHVVKCKGPTSIFAALKVCIPDIVRLSDEYSEYILKDAVSEIELNKFLARSGYLSSRYRNRIRGAKDKWTKGFQRWKFLRWLDPRNPEELRQLSTQIAEIKKRFPGPYSIHDSELVNFISNLQSIHDEDRSRPAGDTCMLELEFDDESNTSDLQLAAFGAPDGPSTPHRWRVEAIPPMHFITHRR